MSETHSTHNQTSNATISGRYSMSCPLMDIEMDEEPRYYDPSRTSYKLIILAMITFVDGSVCGLLGDVQINIERFISNLFREHPTIQSVDIEQCWDTSTTEQESQHAIRKRVKELTSEQNHHLRNRTTYNWTPYNSIYIPVEISMLDVVESGSVEELLLHDTDAHYENLNPNTDHFYDTESDEDSSDDSNDEEWLP